MLILRRFFILCLAMTLAVTTVGCGDNSQSLSQKNLPTQTKTQPQSALADGQYPVQQATYDDTYGDYELALLNTPPGTPAIFRTDNLQMARLSDDEIAQGAKSYLKLENGEPVFYLTEDFRIEYVHSETQTQTNAQTGQPEVVVVRRESSFWSPFAGALAGQALGSLLFRPQYYVPPLYQPGVPLTGFGGYGSSYTQAVDRYQSRYKATPVAVKNRQTFRTTGQVRSPQTNKTVTRSRTSTSDRSTGSGYGSSTLRRSNSPTVTKRKSSGSFGSGSSVRRTTVRRRR